MRSPDDHVMMVGKGLSEVAAMLAPRNRIVYVTVRAMDISVRRMERNMTMDAEERTIRYIILSRLKEAAIAHACEAVIGRPAESFIGNVVDTVIGAPTEPIHEPVIESVGSVDRQAAIISGMARGIDAYAHTAAIKSGGYTIAVLGNGSDICYPKEHIKLYEAIMEKGCILSEYPPGTEARHFFFPARNRLIAALSDTLYVIEAGRNSGTSSTVSYGISYGRKVVKERCFAE